MRRATGVASKSVKLQRPARATVCSHSARDATASVELMLIKTRHLKWSQLHVSWMLRMLSSVDWVLKIAEAEIGQMGSHKARGLNSIDGSLMSTRERLRLEITLPLRKQKP